MLIHLKYITAACILASAAQADGLDVTFQDGNPSDRLVIFNRGCPLSDLTFTLDFATSAGQIVIDTTYTPPGTRDPADVKLIEGNATIQPVEDGSQILTLDIATLPHLGAVVVTMDVDDSTDLFEDARVVATGSEIAGTTATFNINTVASSITLNDQGMGQLTLPQSAAACALS